MAALDIAAALGGHEEGRGKETQYLVVTTSGVVSLPKSGLSLLLTINSRSTSAQLPDRSRARS